MHPGVSLPHYQAEGCMSTCAAAWETEGQFSWNVTIILRAASDRGPGLLNTSKLSLQ